MCVCVCWWVCCLSIGNLQALRTIWNVAVEFECNFNLVSLSAWAAPIHKQQFNTPTAQSMHNPFVSNILYVWLIRIDRCLFVCARVLHNAPTGMKRVNERGKQAGGWRTAGSSSCTRRIIEYDDDNFILRWINTNCTFWYDIQLRPCLPDCLPATRPFPVSVLLLWQLKQPKQLIWPSDRLLYWGPLVFRLRLSQLNYGTGRAWSLLADDPASSSLFSHFHGAFFLVINIHKSYGSIATYRLWPGIPTQNSQLSSNMYLPLDVVVVVVVVVILLVTICVLCDFIVIIYNKDGRVFCDWTDKLVSGGGLGYSQFQQAALECQPRIYRVY